MYLNIAFTVLYMIEAGLKFFALRLVTILEIICFVYMERLKISGVIFGQTL